MITYLNKIKSLDNLKPQRKGQIATVMILVMVFILIMILTTVNVGKNAVRATNIANAADSGALYLGSQLASHAHYLYEEALDNRLEKCKARGWAWLVGAVIVVIIALVISYIYGPAGTIAAYGMVIGFIAGAIGGAIGGAYAGTGATMGGIQGAFVGMAIGSAAAGIAGAGAAGETAGAKAFDTTLASQQSAGVGGGDAAMATANAAYAGAYSSAYTSAIAGSTVQGALYLGSKGYNEYVGDKMTLAAFQNAADQLSGLGLSDQYREGAFYQVFLQVIDDPNLVPDMPHGPDGRGGDLDGDGKTTDMIPAFFSWFNSRAAVLKVVSQRFVAPTDEFFSKLKSFLHTMQTSACTNEVSLGEGESECLEMRDSFFKMLYPPDNTIKEVAQAFQKWFKEGYIVFKVERMEETDTAAESLTQAQANSQAAADAAQAAADAAAKVAADSDATDADIDAAQAAAWSIMITRRSFVRINFKLLAFCLC